ncbi:hypothetical protein C7H79_15950 [Nitrosomonas supralitoralis]|uniref:Uncharacterized protein n=1 Tax=Nitrosomonas supralitoralis TaxID=2116706 RepID=A0A2P7NR85_9PROT|nr:hypothetical protein C7H79_15950 [Nitrosomonas supralitoralis]
MFLVIFPSWIPMIIAVMAYGFLPGALISFAGVFLVSSLGYFIGKNINEAALSEFIRKKSI